MDSKRLIGNSRQSLRYNSSFFSSFLSSVESSELEAGERESKNILNNRKIKHS